MKKITLLLSFFIATICYSQELVVSQIGGMAPGDFHAANTNLVEGSTVTLTIAYTNMGVNQFVGLAIAARFLDDPFNLLGVQVDTPITTSATEQTFDVDLVVPDVTSNQAKVKIQIFGDTNLFSYAGTASGGCCGLEFTINDLITLSTEDFNKNKLPAFYNASLDAIVIKDRIDSGYSIYNLLGQSVLEGEIANADKISVESLKSGLYILSTKEGTLKFVK